MSVSGFELLLYAGAIFLLFATPGPVWVAVIARAVSGGFWAAVPLTLGVVVGDVLWPIVAIFGVSYLVALYADFIIVLKYIAVIMFVMMGIFLLRKPIGKIEVKDNFLATVDKADMWAGFVAGLLAILGNPKAVLFYMGVLPGFFDFRTITALDILAICFISLIITLTCNLALAAMVDRMRKILASPAAIGRLNKSSGIALICVGVVIALS